jgi:hypothetical protein
MREVNRFEVLQIFLIALQRDTLRHEIDAYNNLGMSKGPETITLRDHA